MFCESKVLTLSCIFKKNIMVKNYFCNKYFSPSSCNPNTEVLYYYMRTYIVQLLSYFHVSGCGGFFVPFVFLLTACLNFEYKFAVQQQ